MCKTKTTKAFRRMGEKLGLYMPKDRLKISRIDLNTGETETITEEEFNKYYGV